MAACIATVMILVLANIWVAGDMLEVDVAVLGVLGYSPNLGPLHYNVAPRELAVENVNSQFNGSLHFNLELVYNSRHQSCSQYIDDVTDMAASWYYRKRRAENVSLSVVVSPGMLTRQKGTSTFIRHCHCVAACGEANLIGYLCGLWDVFYMAT